MRIESYLPSDSDESDDDYAFISGQYLEDTDWTQNTRRSRSIHGGKLLHRTLQCCVCVKCVEAFSRINLACAILAVCSVVAVLQFGGRLRSTRTYPNTHVKFGLR